jgi:hypothetical protein
MLSSRNPQIRRSISAIVEGTAPGYRCISSWIVAERAMGRAGAAGRRIAAPSSAAGVRSGAILGAVNIALHISPVRRCGVPERVATKVAIARPHIDPDGS